ncbi:prepilin-type N-terminal cleavage/methylation domain-containing protein [bacterium]|nr:prepilin-type N-terminal cleavage/methylation domain-containing protein [bacterium]
MKNRGFTLVELLIAIAIITILASVSFVGYGQRQKEIALQKEANILVSKIEEVKEMAISARYFHNDLPTGGFGVYFNISSPNSYIIFADCDGDRSYDTTGSPCFDPIHSTNYPEFVERVSFDHGVYIKTLPAPVSITFKPPSPDVAIKTSSGLLDELTIKLGVTGSFKEKDIHFNSAGLVYVE